MRMAFHAAHRLRAATLSDAENAKLYGKCNNPLGHGHGYLTETTTGGEYDERSGTLYDFVAFRKAIQESLEPWRDRHLDLETEDFRTPRQLAKISCAPCGQRSIIASISDSLGCACGRRRIIGSPCGESEALAGTAR